MAAAPGSPRNRRNSRITARLPRYVALGVVLVALSVLAAGAAAAPAESLGAAAQQQRFTVTPLVPASRVEGAKSASGRIAQTDESLLGLSSDAPVNVVVKLDYDAVASYAGQIEGLPATSPAETGKPLNMQSNAAQSYLDYVRDIEQRFLARLDTRVPDADVGRALRVAYGGVALTVPGNEVGELLKLPGAVAVQDDSPEQLLTDSSPAFIGAPTIYGQLGGNANEAGKGTIVGVLDTGAWPEHPSFADPGTLPAPPPKADGTPRTCNFGDNPLTPATDVFVCQRKLISGQPFLATYNAVFGGEVYPTSARDSNGHGSHTSSTSAGGPVANANPLGINRGPIRGVAPGAHVAVYKNCGAAGLLPLGLGRRRGPGDPRRRRRHQLLHRRRRGSLRRPRRARLPRRLRGRRLRVGERRERRPGRGDQRPQLAVGDDRRGLDAGADVPLDDHAQRRGRRDAADRGRDHHRRHREPAAGRPRLRPALQQRRLHRTGAARALHRQDRRLRAGPRSHPSAASTSARAAPWG